MSKGDLG